MGTSRQSKNTESSYFNAWVKTQAAVTKHGSAMHRYQTVVVGNRSFWTTLYYEWCTWLGCVPGATGLFLRKQFWPRLFGSCGKGVTFGSNIILRHPKRIHLGDRTVISEGCILDARNEYSEKVIVIGNDVILSNYVTISSKDGSVEIGKRTGIGIQTIVQSTTHCPISIGADVIIGPRCNIVAGGNFNTERLDIPIWRQGIKNDHGLQIEDDVWLGSNATVLGGATMGKGSIAAAGAVINKSVPSNTICGGVPAKVLKIRVEAGQDDVSAS